MPIEKDIFYYAKQGNKQQISDYIERKFYCPNITNGLGKSLLMFVCEYGHVKCAEYLISLGADVNNRDKYNNTALSLAKRRGNKKGCKECVELLKQKGASSSTYNQYPLPIPLFADPKFVDMLFN